MSIAGIHLVFKGKAASAGAVCAVVAGLCGPASASSPAGVEVANTARLSYLDSGEERSATSNTVRLRVLQVLDVRVEAAEAFRDPRDGSCSLGFRISNPGNGPQTYRLDVAASGFGPQTPALTVEGGEPGRLTLAASGSGLARLRGGSIGDACRAELTATAEAGHGAPGLLLPGAGLQGVDAVVGATGARGRAEASVAPTGGVGGGAGDVRVMKRQSVRDPDGGARTVPGAIVTYTLEVDLGDRPVSAVGLADPIPAGLAYVPGSLRLDAAALTDAADGDGGRFDGRAVEVRLDAAAARRRVVTFQTRILQPGA